MLAHLKRKILIGIYIQRYLTMLIFYIPKRSHLSSDVDVKGPSITKVDCFSKNSTLQWEHIFQRRESSTRLPSLFSRRFSLFVRSHIWMFSSCLYSSLHYCHHQDHPHHPNHDHQDHPQHDHQDHPQSLININTIDQPQSQYHFSIFKITSALSNIHSSLSTCCDYIG